MIFLVRRLSLSGDRGGDAVLSAEEGVVVVTTVRHRDGDISRPLSLLTAFILLLLSLHRYSPCLSLSFSRDRPRRRDFVCQR